MLYAQPRLVYLMHIQPTMPEPAKIDLSLGCALMQIATKSAVRQKVPGYAYEYAIRLTMGDGRTEQLACDDEPALRNAVLALKPQKIIIDGATSEAERRSLHLLLANIGGTLVK